MRRTMFVVPLDLAAVMDASCTKALVPGERRKLVQMLTEAGVADDVDAWIDRVRAETMAGLAANDPLPASALTKLVPDLALQLRVAVGKKYEGTVGVSTRMLFLMSTAGDIVRTRPRGTWLSSQYRWTTTEQWIGGLPTIEPDAARAELVRRWLGAFGPGTTDDIAWWTKWTKAHVKAALAEVGAVEVSADTGDDDKAAAWALADDLDDTSESAAAPDGVEPVALLPSLDSTVMGWRAAVGTSGPTGRSCSTATATRVPRCGWAAGPSARGASATVARWSPRSSNPSRPAPSIGSPPRPKDRRRGWTACGSRPGSPTRSSGNSRVGHSVQACEQPSIRQGDWCCPRPFVTAPVCVPDRSRCSPTGPGSASSRSPSTSSNSGTAGSSSAVRASPSTTTPCGALRHSDQRDHPPR